MKKRCIAALVVVALAWWSVPVALASPTQAHPFASPEPDQRAAPKAHDHSCCPGLHSLFATLALVRVAPAAMPCGDQHPCCTKQGPDNLPSLPAATRVVRPDSHDLAATLREDKHYVRNCIDEKPSIDLFQSYFERSTVLRI